MKFFKTLLNIIRGVPSRTELAALTENDLVMWIGHGHKLGRYDTPYVAERARRMSDRQLLAQINLDAEDGMINTAYSREYDSRRGARNLAHGIV